MNILLAYSAKHFNPLQGEETSQTFSASSAATLARSLYHILKEMGDVEYVDGLRPPKKLARKHYDLLVGIQGSISPLCRIATFDKVVLFAVNMHPRSRNEILQQFNRQYRVCSQKHVDRNTVHLKQLSDIKRADSIFLVGNATVARSFLQDGREISSIRRFNYASALPCRAEDSLVPGDMPRLLYVTTEMCLRKGFDIVADMLQKLQDVPFVCGIIGGAGESDYQSKLSDLQQRFGAKVHLHGWVDSGKPAYKELLQKYDFVLFPSLEEGQAGSVLDAMSQGLIPLITRETGIDFAPLGYLHPELNCEHNNNILQQAVSMSKEQVLKLQQQTLRYYRIYHLNWQGNLKRAFRNLLHSGTPWPEYGGGDASEYYLKQDTSESAMLIYDILDRLELVTDSSAAAIIGSTKDAKRIRWKETGVLPPGSVLQIHRRAAEGNLYLLGEANEHGEDLLSTPSVSEVTAGRSVGKIILSGIARLLSLLHPSKRRRKNYYNRYINLKENIH